MLKLASATANEIERMEGYKSTRAGFAVVALRELSESGQAL